ncbi:helix-turn-helix domain-containing protein [Patescibacteria group bacterium]|nr:helix-turn-helix domain-containing protein [Patescibacteria group bacterium]
MANNKSVIAENIKKYRKKKGITQDKLSKIADITYNTIIKIESGATCNPRVETLKQIADALGVSIDDLMS